MREDEAIRIETALDFKPDVLDDEGDSHWECEVCKAVNSCLDGECQYCGETLSDMMGEV